VTCLLDQTAYDTISGGVCRQTACRVWRAGSVGAHPPFIFNAPSTVAYRSKVLFIAGLPG
jgi:hypothetical protein